MFNMSTLPTTFVPGFHDKDAVKKMKYSPLGQTGLRVSHLSLGGGALAWYGEFSEDEAIETIRQAIKQGINYIDTAPWYGQGRSEQILGKALKDIPRQAYYIGTKVGRYECQPEKMFDFSIEKTLESVNNSLKLLGLDYVDIIQVHDVEFAPSNQVVHETLPTLQQIVQSGKAYYVGITGYPVSTLKEIIQNSRTHISTVLSYCRMTLLDNTLKDYISYFQMQGIGIINASTVAMGLLTNSGPQSWHPAHQEIKDICKQAGQYCKERGVELGRLALSDCLQQPGVATHLVGMNSLEILNMNLDLVHNGLSDLELKVLDEVKEKFFSKLKQRHWEGVELSRYQQQLGH